MTLDEILDLALLARRSPHARRVLHDALLERYPDAYGFALKRAHETADAYGKPQIVMFAPNLLVDAEDAWRMQYLAYAFRAEERGEEPDPRRGLPPHAAWNWGVFSVYTPADLQFSRNRSQATAQLLYTALPRGFVRRARAGSER